MFLKKICLIVIAALTLLVTDLKALPVGNPLDATWLCNGLVWEGSCYEPCDPCLCWQDTWSFRFGYYGDFVFNRYMEVDNHHNRPAIRHTELFTNAAYLAFNVWDRFDVFASLGDSTLRIQTPGSAFFLNTDDDPNNNVLNIELNTHFSWSIGGRATLWECGCFGFGAEAQYFSYKSKVNYVDNAFETPLYLSDAGTKYHEYQFGIGATYQIPIAGCGTFVVPYFAVKWAHAKLDMGNFLLIDNEGDLVELFHLHNQRTTGVAIGLTLVGCRVWSLTAEARYIDELALHINSQIRF